MSFEQLIQQGDYKGALEVLRQVTSAPRVDPGILLTRFNMEVRLQEFDAAASTMQRLCQAAPEAAPVMKQLGLTAEAERLAVRRLSESAVAQKRSTLGAPPPHALAMVKAAVAHAQGDAAGAKAALAEARAMTPATSGTLVQTNGATVRFTNLVDSDDLTGPILPVYEGAHLLDVAYSEIRSINFLDPATSFDVMWPRAEIMLVTGEVLRVRVPALYPGSGVSGERFIRTGQMTIWSRDKGYAEGHGQRDLSVTTADGGNSVIGLLSIVSMTFDNPLRAAVGGPGTSALQEAPYTTSQKAVMAVAGILGVIMFLRPSIILEHVHDTSMDRFIMLFLGLLVAGGFGWVTMQRSDKRSAVIVAVIVFLVTSFRWIL